MNSDTALIEIDNQDTIRKYCIIEAISSMNKPTMRDIEERVQLPVSTIKRQIRLIRKTYIMEVEFVQHENAEGQQGRGRKGYWEIKDWGIIDKKKFNILFAAIKKSELYS